MLKVNGNTNEYAISNGLLLEFIFLPGNVTTIFVQQMNEAVECYAVVFVVTVR